VVLQPFSLIEQAEFIDLLCLIKSDIQNDDIPEQKALTASLMREYRLLYLVITGHYIDPNSNGSAWELEEDIIGFKELGWSHSGNSLAEYVVGVLNELGIEMKVCDQLLILNFTCLTFTCLTTKSLDG